VRSGTTRDDRKTRKPGRHTAPSQLNKVISRAAAASTPKAVRRAGIAVPVVAVLGALAAASQLNAFTSSTAAPPATSSRQAEAAVQVALTGPAARAVNTPDRLPESIRSDLYQPPRPKPVQASKPAPVATHQSAVPAQPASTPAAHTASCSGSSSGMLPANYAAIFSFLTAHGYTGNAAAGIAGNIYQESEGNPESVGSGGGGLIGWTPLPAGFVTGNPAADLQTQLAAILTFNQQWAQYLPALNAASSPAAAADIYVQDFERAGIPAAATREAAAEAVAAACGL
jgi:Phage tail lysozyme